MDDSEQQSDYTRFYIKRQEQILIESIKKNIDLEVKLAMLIDNINNLSKKHEEALQTIETQQEIINQATVSIEELTTRKIENENIIKNLTDRADKAAETNRTIIEEKNSVVNEINMQKGRLNDLEREVNRLNEELRNADKPSKKITKSKEDDF
jgi:chromosome segregation ATPase